MSLSADSCYNIEPNQKVITSSLPCQEQRSKMIPQMFVESVKKMDPFLSIQNAKSFIQIRQNKITWLFLIYEKLKLSEETLFNTISLFEKVMTCREVSIQDDDCFHSVLTVICLLLSCKEFEKKSLTFGYIRKHLLQESVSEETLRKAEVFVISKLNYQVLCNNGFFFSKYFEEVMSRYLPSASLQLVKRTVETLMKRAIMLPKFHFEVNPVEEAMIVINISFLMLNQLNLLKVSELEFMFQELSEMTSQMSLCNFPEYTELLISSINLETEVIVPLYEFKAIYGL